jgi:Tfp pilus assembly protein PilO
MTNNRMLWWAGTAVVGLLLAAACWFLALSPMLDDARAADTEAGSAELANDSRRLEVARLAADRQNQPALEAELAELRRHFPTTLELEPFVQQLADLSGRSGATVQSVTRSDPTESEVGNGRLYQVQVNLVVDGSPEQKMQYLSDLQSMDDRLLLVTAWNNPGTDSMTVTAYTFVLVDAAAVQAPPSAVPDPEPASS